MNFTLQFDRKQRILVVTFGATVNQSIFLEAYAAVEQFCAGEIPAGAIVDFSCVATCNISADFVRRMAARPPAIPAGRMRVNVAPRPDVYGMARMYQMLREEQMGGDIRVVRTAQEAYTILRIEPPDCN